MCRIDSQSEFGCGPQRCAPQGEQSGAVGCGGSRCTLGASCFQWGPGHPGYVEPEKEKKK